jgi:ATP-binding protein involved in chromosome partitioning
MSVSEQQVQDALRALVDPNTQKDFISSKSARNIKVDGGNVTLDVVLPYPAKMVMGDIKKMVEDTVKAAEGASVGMLDADIYGPSQPTMLGITGRPESPDGQNLEPMLGHGLQAMSIGFLIDVETPMVWRGPMVTQALEQLLNQTKWKDLDYLVVDLPPGTGDIQLTLAQRVPVTGAVIVTTPQDIALIDARKGLKMFEKVGVPILGVVENMSLHICSNCGHEERIFGEGGGERMCKDYGTEFLGALPLDIRIREETDSGKPTVVAEPESRIAEIYRAIARRVAVKVGDLAVDHSSKFPSIVIQNT